MRDYPDLKSCYSKFALDNDFVDFWEPNYLAFSNSIWLVDFWALERIPAESASDLGPLAFEFCERGGSIALPAYDAGPDF